MQVKVFLSALVGCMLLVGLPAEAKTARKSTGKASVSRKTSSSKSRSAKTSTSSKSRSKAKTTRASAKRGSKSGSALRTSSTTARRSTSASSKKSKSKSRYAKSSQPRRSSAQAAPTPERYREIQEALATKGYLQGPPSGSWGPESVDALRRFQQDQNLKADGKLDALTIIALGLGPKRDYTAQTKPEPSPTRTEQP